MNVTRNELIGKLFPQARDLIAEKDPGYTAIVTHEGYGLKVLDPQGNEVEEMRIEPGVVSGYDFVTTVN